MPANSRAKLPAPSPALTAECTSLLRKSFLLPNTVPVSGPVQSWTHSTRRGSQCQLHVRPGAASQVPGGAGFRGRSQGCGPLGLSIRHLQSVLESQLMLCTDSSSGVMLRVLCSQTLPLLFGCLSNLGIILLGGPFLLALSLSRPGAFLN